MKFFVLVISLTLCMAHMETYAQPSSSYKIIYSADADGKSLSGSLDQLTKAVHSGSPLRVGWVLEFNDPGNVELTQMRHWADAGFITTLNGHVFAQLRPIFQQGPAPGKIPAVILSNNKPNGWVAIVGTTGEIRQKFNDFNIPEDILKEMELMKATTFWAVPKN